MIFSVYDSEAKLFDYFEVPGQVVPRATKYRTLTQGPQGNQQLGGIGYAPEALALRLPPGARQVGRGQRARGIVAFAPNVRRMPVAMTPASPSSWEESGAAGLGDVAEVQVTGPSFGQVVAAACIASVVGVFVQRALKKD